jgi:hypothetical protein
MCGDVSGRLAARRHVSRRRATAVNNGESTTAFSCDPGPRGAVQPKEQHRKRQVAVARVSVERTGQSLDKQDTTREASESVDALSAITSACEPVKRIACPASSRATTPLQATQRYEPFLWRIR